MPLVKRRNSRFWYVQFQLNHRTFVRSTRTTDRKAAEKMEAQLRAEVHSELILGRKRSVSLGEALSRFIETKEGTPNHRNLRQRKKSVLQTLSASRSLASLTNEDLEQHRQLRTREGRAPQTIKHELNLIMGTVRFAKRMGFEAPELSPPPIKIANTRLRYLTIDEEHRLLRELDPMRVGNGIASATERDAKKRQAMQDNYDLVVMLLDTGARYSEISSLSWDQIDLENKVIRLWRSKVENESLLFMTSRVADIIAKRLRAKRSKFVFSKLDGSARGYSVIAIRKAFKRAGLHDCTVHTLRHTHASRLIQHGMSVYEVKSVLGHADIRTTMRYAHLEEAKVTSRARDLIERLNGAEAEI